MFDERSIAHGKTCGILNMFADLNTDVNYQCFFSFECVEKPADVQAAVEAYFAEVAQKVELVSLQDQQEHLQLTLEYWLFGFLLPPKLHPSRMLPFSLPPQEAYLLLKQAKKKNWASLFLREPDIPSLNSFQANRRRRWTSNFMTEINLLVQPTTIWEVNMPEGTLGTDLLRSDTFAFENPDSVFILRLGFCD